MEVATEDERAEDSSAEVDTIVLEASIAAGSNAIRRRVAGLLEEAQTARRKRLKQILRETDQAWEELYELIALATDPIYTREDVRRWCERNVELGCGHPIFDSGTVRALLKYERVPNEPFRLAYRDAIGKGALTQAACTELVDEAVGGYGGEGGADKLRRQLGIFVTHTGSGPSVSFLMPYETAAALAGILDLNPHECGV